MDYGCESWTMRNGDENVFVAMVKTIFGVTLRDRKRIDEYMPMLLLNEVIVTLVRQSILRWLGRHVLRHVLRKHLMDEER
jgi:hypothetical protein